MRVTLVHWSRGDREFHPGVAAMSAILKREGHECRVIVDDDTLTPEDYEDHIRDYDPQMFGFTCMSFQWQPVRERASWVKNIRSDLPVIVGGYHPTALPEMCLKDPSVDMICRASAATMNR